MLLKILLCPIAILFELLNTLLAPTCILTLGLFRYLIPIKTVKTSLTNLIEKSGSLWATLNHFILQYLLQVKVTIIGKENLSKKKNYFVISNHQSWADILLLEEALYKCSGLSRYFIKKNLLHFPVLGWSLGVLRFPYMHRFTKSHLAKHPEDKGKDVAITKRACENLRGIYFKLNNFPEGTRFTKEKHERQASPYKNLLKPKSGGIAHALQILHDQLDAFVNMTIIYAEKPNIVKLFFGQMTKVTILLEKISITPDLIGDYENDRAFKAHFQSFVTKLWERKDALITDCRTH